MSEQSNNSSGLDVVDAAVDTAVAAVLADGLDSGRDTPVSVDTQLHTCSNCDTTVHGRYCSNCGQLTDTHVPTLPELLGDAIGNFFDLDSRVWRTLGVLLFKPGKLTEEYLAGRRARYILPLRLYLALSIIFFLIAALPDNTEQREVEMESAFEAGMREQVEQEVDADVAAIIAAATEEAAASGDTNDGPDCDLPAGFGPELQARFKQACLDAAADDFEDLKEGFVDNVALMAFLIIPLMAAVFKLFYMFAGRGYLEHLAFLCHTHAFTLCLFAFSDLFGEVGEYAPALRTLVGFVLFVLMMGYLPAYYFVALRRVYRQGVGLTLLKMLPLFFIYMLVITFVFALGLVVLIFTTAASST